jgi:N-acetyl-gamma-glutamyl-phosphate reductase
MFEHQHQPEVDELLESVNPAWGSDTSLVFQVHSIPVVRGIFGTVYFTPAESMTADRVGALLSDFYDKEFFIRLVDGSPDINWVKNTNFVDIGWAARRDTVMVLVALDNLVKGAAGQAVQNMVMPGANP